MRLDRKGNSIGKYIKIRSRYFIYASDVLDIDRPGLYATDNDKDKQNNIYSLSSEHDLAQEFFFLMNFEQSAFIWWTSFMSSHKQLCKITQKKYVHE